MNTLSTLAPQDSSNNNRNLIDSSNDRASYLSSQIVRILHDIQDLRQDFSAEEHAQGIRQLATRIISNHELDDTSLPLLYKIHTLLTSTYIETLQTGPPLSK